MDVVRGHRAIRLSISWSHCIGSRRTFKERDVEESGYQCQTRNFVSLLQMKMKKEKVISVDTDLDTDPGGRRNYLLGLW